MKASTIGFVLALLEERKLADEKQMESMQEAAEKLERDFQRLCIASGKDMKSVIYDNKESYDKLRFSYIAAKRKLEASSSAFQDFKDSIFTIKE